MGQRRQAHGPQVALVGQQRMAGEVKAEGLLFEGHHLLVVPFGQGGLGAGQSEARGRLGLFGHERHEREAAVVFLGGPLLADGGGLVEAGHEPGPGAAEAVAGPALDEVFDDALGEFAHVHPAGEIQQRGEGPAGLAFDHDFGHGVAADVFDGGQAVEDPVVLDGKVRVAGVDVGRQQFEVVVAAGGDVLQELVLVFHVRGHQRRHEGHRVMGLEVGRVVGDQGVGGAVGLVEAVLRELLHQVENLVGFFGLDAVAGTAVDEKFPLLAHLLGVFLAHGPAQQVAGAERKAGQHLGDLHDLFLVDDDAVGRLQRLLQERVGVFDRVLAVLCAG